MKLTAEISMYPFNENYLDPIKWFIGGWIAILISSA